MRETLLYRNIPAKKRKLNDTFRISLFCNPSELMNLGTEHQERSTTCRGKQVPSASRGADSASAQGPTREANLSLVNLWVPEAHQLTIPRQKDKVNTAMTEQSAQSKIVGKLDRSILLFLYFLLANC